MTAHDPSGSTPILITTGKIANIAGVRPPAVSNWKRRHTNFPAEMEEGLYDQSEVVSWLRAAGKTVNLPEQESDESLIRRLADAVRGMLRVDQTPEILLQLFTLRASASGKYDRLLPLENAWAELGNQAPERLGSAARSIVDSAGASDPELARALRFSPAIDRLQSSEWARLVKLVDQLDPHSTDWGQASTSLIEGFVKRHNTKGGAYSSGSSLVDLMAALLEPIKGTVYDPACGAATFLASVWKRHSDTITGLYGQEINEQSWRLGFLHLLLQNAPFEFLTGDIMVDDQLWQLRADRVAVEPPFGPHLHSVEQMQGDPRWSLGLPPKSPRGSGVGPTRCLPLIRFRCRRGCSPPRRAGPHQPPRDGDQDEDVGSRLCRRSPVPAARDAGSLLGSGRDSRAPKEPHEPGRTGSLCRRSPARNAAKRRSTQVRTSRDCSHWADASAMA